MKVKNKNKGVFFIVAAALGFSLMSMFVKLAGNLPPFQKAIFRNAVAFIFFFFIMLKKKKSFKPQKANAKDLIFRCLFGTIGIICNFYAVSHLVLADANMLNKLSPFFAIICSIFILKEKPTAMQIIGVIIAFFGSVFIIKPSFANTSLVPSLIGLIGGLCAGIAYTFVRRLGQNKEDSSLIILFFSGASTLLCAPFVILNYEPMTKAQTVFLVCAGISACLGQYGITKAYLYAPAKEISVYDYSQVIFAAIIGYFVFNQTPDILSVAGYIMICSAGIAMFLYNKKK